jgi:hypothetical protein
MAQESRVSKFLERVPISQERKQMLGAAVRHWSACSDAVEVYEILGDLPTDVVIDLIRDPRMQAVYWARILRQ